MTRRYEDVEGPGGDDPRDRSLYSPEADPLEVRPTRAECDADARELREWPPRYADGNAL